jgi:hypothetical protein
MAGRAGASREDVGRGLCVRNWAEGVHWAAREFFLFMRCLTSCSYEVLCSQLAVAKECLLI